MQKPKNLVENFSAHFFTFIANAVKQILDFLPGKSFVAEILLTGKFLSFPPLCRQRLRLITLELQTQKLGVLHSSTELQQRLKVGHSNPTAADPCQLIALSAASL